MVGAMSIAAGLAWLAVAVRVWQLGRTGDRVAGWLGRQRGPVRPVGAPSWLQTWLPMFGPIGRQMTLNRQKLARWAQLAGHPRELRVEEVMALKAMGFTGGMVAGILVRLLGLGGPLSVLVLAAAGYVTPDVWLRTGARRRQVRLAADLPDLMDLIATCLESGAGLSIAQVLRRAEEHLNGPVREELTTLNRQIEIGMSREETYQALLERNECEELQSLVETLRRGGELGVPIVETVRAQARVMQEIRRRRARWAGERADLWVSAITFALSLPSVLAFIFALFLITLITRPEVLGFRLW